MIKQINRSLKLKQVCATISLILKMKCSLIYFLKDARKVYSFNFIAINIRYFRTFIISYTFA